MFTLLYLIQYKVILCYKVFCTLRIHWMFAPCASCVPEVRESSVLISWICVYDRMFVGQVFTIPLYEHRGDRRQERRRRHTLLPLPITHTYIYFIGYILVTTLQDPPPESVQNSNTVKRQSKYPSLPFGTNGAHSPCILASPLAPMAHAVRVS